jgi:hypothetical protein
MRLRTIVTSALLGTAVLAPAAHADPSSCPTQALVQHRDGHTYLAVPDPVHRCQSIVIGPLDTIVGP